MRSADPSFTGWWISISIGFTVVVVVVILVAMILTYAARILDQAVDGHRQRWTWRAPTRDPVWGLQDINVSATDIWRTRSEPASSWREEPDAHHRR